jgi:carboxypeptidase Q
MPLPMNHEPLKNFLLLLFCTFYPAWTIAQTDDSLAVAKFYNEALASHEAYENLQYLCSNIGGRLCGSPQSAEAVGWTKSLMERTGADTVYLQEVMVPHWVRGERETAQIMSEVSGTIPVRVCALGGSVGTGRVGLAGQMIEVSHMDALRALGSEVTGKIIFFNRPADQRFVNTFRSYSSAVDQRVSGAAEAALLGAAGVVVRAVTTAFDTVPHTGITRYEKDGKNIPAVAISTKDADILSDLLKKDPELRFFFRTTCGWKPDELSHNVIGEFRGSQFPDEFITIGGHLDSWDLGEGAHDDGAGCIQSIEVLRLFKALNIVPRHTIRVVMFMDEEISQSGSKAYAERALEKKEKHFLALEADRGGFTPFGFSIDVPDSLFNLISKYRVLFEPYGADRFTRGGSGPDIWRLKEQGALVAGLVVDSQRYFDYHHSAKDTFDKVNRRELQLGSAAMAAFVYLLDKDDGLR